MPVYSAPLKEMQFLLHEVLKISRAGLPAHTALEPDFTDAVLGEAAKLAEDVLAPLNPVGDREGCTLENGGVRTPTGFKAGFDTLRRGGWMALDAPHEFGGQGLPCVIHMAVNEMFVSANMALNIYQGLTHGAWSTILAHGSTEQVATYVPKLVAGDWTGTMNLTEPQCGTDLGLVRTRAEPQPDGSYRITGQKIFISAGDHDLAENIVHLVLARAPGGGDGTKGISLFIVPKLLVNADGSLGARNGVSVGKVERKMGIHGNATCLMNYDGAQGWLLGGLHKGMKAMFTMMNEARLAVGLQGYAVAEVAYQNALTYAKDRLQGRDVTGPQNPLGPADPLIVHPDIRRNLMEQKSFVEGARALTFWGATLIDRARQGDADAEALISLLIPVIKGFLTDQGFQMTVQAQQVFGGHGYIEEQGLSQFVRDARIAMIYEGANGVQALDLVGRKLGADGGKAVTAFFEQVKADCMAQGADARMADLVDALKAAVSQLQQAVMYFLAEGVKAPNAALAGSHDFLQMMGHVCLGLMWLRMAAAAQSALDAGTGDRDFLAAKLATARFYMARQLPACGLYLARIESGAAPVMALAAEAF